MATSTKNKLSKKTTDDLKKDVVSAKESDVFSSMRIFIFGLEILEKRLSGDEYKLFQESL
jgi:hypothetical protein